MADDATVVLTDIKAALASTENEAALEEKPPALLIVGGDLNGTLFDINSREVGIGRSPDNGIQIEFDGISRHHFKIEMQANKAILHDLGSKNGTYLNNTRCTGSSELYRGDIIKIGSVALKYLPKGDPERLTYDKLSLDANTDKHTKCYNKTYFNKAIAHEVQKCKITGKPLTLILFDLDHFKNLNDNYGHDAGDFVLLELAKIIRTHGVRDLDIFARYGGEEFVILLPQTNLKQAFSIAERVRKVVEEHEFIYDDKLLPVTASIGVADYRQGVNDGTELFKRADTALYKSKEGGRNQVQFFKE
ncbi:MAG: GGDEF domain-containing protein [Bacteriovoracaceae bacterium]|nr:GGDEF domain-containing protein [Bacteriovoracaceae bacterium]